MNQKLEVHGLMAQFLTPEAILEATRRARQAGFRTIDAYTPYTVDGLAIELGMRPSRLPSVVLIGGLVGAGAAYFMQYFAMAYDYPLNVGGRPYNSWPAFIPITFEVLILVAALAAFLAMLLLNGLPHPNHPVFNVPEFARASQDRFFLCIESTDSQFEMESTAAFLGSLQPCGPVIVIPIAPEAIEEPVSNASEPHQRRPATVEPETET
jgi:hypothetical protein